MNFIYNFSCHFLKGVRCNFFIRFWTKGTFSITGEVEINLMAEDHEAPDIEPVNRKVALNAIDRRLKEKGIDAFDLQLAIKVKELDVDELYPPVETDTVADPPF